MSKLQLNRDARLSIQNEPQVKPVPAQPPQTQQAKTPQPVPTDTLQLQSKPAKNPLPTSGVLLKPIGELLKLNQMMLNPTVPSGSHTPQKTAPPMATVKHASLVEENQLDSAKAELPSTAPTAPKTAIEGQAASHTTAALIDEPAPAADKTPKPAVTLNEGAPPLQIPDPAVSEKGEVKINPAPTAPGKTPLERYLYRLTHHQESRAALLKTPTGAAFIEALEGLQPKGRLTKAQVIAIQSHLVNTEQVNLSYKGHKTGIDGMYGTLTKKALAEFLTKQAPAAETAPANSAPSPYPRYDKMFQDGLLDVTVAIGYDEPVGPWDGANLNEEQKMDYELGQRGYVSDPEKAKQLLKAAGREVNGHYQGLYVKENIATQNGKPVHSVVRVIKSGRADLNTGTQTREAALEGMNQSDAFLYGGHARYGSGPDFDRNYKVTIDWTDFPNAPASGKVTYQDYEALKNLLSAKGNHAEAIAKFEALEKEGRIGIETSNAGNIVLNKQNKHPGEFGAHVMFKAVESEKTTALKEQILQDSYRLWLFNACRTGDYVDNIRQDGKVNQRLNERNLDLFYTTQTLYWHNTTANVVAFLDGVLAQDNTANLLKRLGQANPEHQTSGRTHARQGFDDNPLANPVKF